MTSFMVNRYIVCVLLMCDGSSSFGFLDAAFLGTVIKTYFKLY